MEHPLHELEPLIELAEAPVLGLQRVEGMLAVVQQLALPGRQVAGPRQAPQAPTRRSR